MRRRARTFLTGAGLVVVLTGGLSACTGSSDSDSGGGDTKPGGTSAAEPDARPGRYRTLPEPCGEVSRETLEKMLPGAESAADDDGGLGSSTPPSPFEGEATVTYDTDRRAGCTWQSATSLGSRHLTVDFERVVSYDPTVGDDEQTDVLYAERAEKAGISLEDDPSASDDADADGDEGTDDGGKGADASPDPGGATPEGGKAGEAVDGGPKGDGGSDGGNGDGEAEDGNSPSGSPSPTDDPSGSPDPEEPEPSRTLDGIGDAAFIADELVSAKSGRATHRDVQLVFRRANVLVTVEYTQSVADERRTPDGVELQERAQELARQLAARFDDD
ncbi:hypothetical protein [Streptomyces phytohabitans]|uniref:hypothetical protein n=1 Tax=Streptomyces phytohabitans TaxID=1150371 RepID=UPI00345C453D